MADPLGIKIVKGALTFTVNGHSINRTITPFADEPSPVDAGGAVTTLDDVVLKTARDLINAGRILQRFSTAVLYLAFNNVPVAAKGELALEQDFVHQGILGTTFSGRLIREVEIGGTKAVVPTISGSAWVTAK